MTEPTSYANEYLLELQSKPPLMRTNHENEYLYYHFLHFPFFEDIIHSNNNLGDLMYRAIINCLNFKTFQPGTPIFKINDPITNMFILIEGEVNIYKKPKVYKKLKKTTPKKSINSFKLGLQNLISATLERQVEKTLKVGESYGQALFTFGKKHLCLVEAKTYCIIGEIARYDYMIIFQKTNFLERITGFNFLIRINAFKNVDNSRIIELLYKKMKKSKYYKGEFILKQGETFDKFFFVKRGRFKLLKSHNTTMRSSVMNTYLNDINDLNEERFTTNRLYELKDEYVDKWKMELLIYEKGEIIGDVEYLFNQTKYLFSIQCDEDGSEILELQLSDFNRITNDDFKKVFNDNISFKLKQIKARIKNTKNNPVLKKYHKNKYNELFINKINKVQQLELENNKTTNLIQIPKTKGRNKIDLYGLVYDTNDNINNVRLRSATYNAKTMNKYDYKKFNLITQVPGIKTNHLEDPVQTNFINEGEFMKRRLKQKGVLISNNSINNKKRFIPILQYCPNLGDQHRQTSASLKIAANRNKNKIFKLQSSINKTDSKKMEELQTTDKSKQSNRLLFENDKRNYSYCFEVNKQFFINNNTSILKKQNTLNGLFMNNNNNQNNNVYCKTLPNE